MDSGERKDVREHVIPSGEEVWPFTFADLPDLPVRMLYSKIYIPVFLHVKELDLIALGLGLIILIRADHGRKDMQQVCPEIPNRPSRRRPRGMTILADKKRLWN